MTTYAWGARELKLPEGRAGGVAACLAIAANQGIQHLGLGSN